MGDKAMFEITFEPGKDSAPRAKGFILHFPNGWAASVQWGASNHCDNYGQHPPAPIKTCPTAEVGAFSKSGGWMPFPDGAAVKTHQTPEQVAGFLAEVAALPPVRRFVNGVAVQDAPDSTN